VFLDSSVHIEVFLVSLSHLAGEGEGDIEAEGLNDALGDTEGDVELEGLVLAEGLTDGDELDEGLTEGEVDAEGLTDGEAELLGEAEELGETEALGEGVGEGELDGEVDADGETDGEIDDEGETEEEGDTEGLAEELGDTEGETEEEPAAECVTTSFGSVEVPAVSAELACINISLALSHAGGSLSKSAPPLLPNLLTPVLLTAVLPAESSTKALYAEVVIAEKSKLAYEVEPSWSKSSTTRSVFEAGVEATM